MRECNVKKKVITSFSTFQFRSFDCQMWSFTLSRYFLCLDKSSTWFYLHVFKSQKFHTEQISGSPAGEKRSSNTGHESNTHSGVWPGCFGQVSLFHLPFTVETQSALLSKSAGLLEVFLSASPTLDKNDCFMGTRALQPPTTSQNSWKIILITLQGVHGIQGAQGGRHV